ncbi:MAG: hypothetical protein DWQ07_06430 [Chloroflexi bacterium]|nr:MAG: hypothetical protein DWQ07_06430 [Chloroflexota bacterium]MBL1195934.1 hypothetical protein [Chloroflexota bacterium]NOH13227.1 hypothetical protein [Chloroflexota bacterium]
MPNKWAAYEQAREERPWRIHPVWRGIGFILILIIPVFSYAASDLTVEALVEREILTLPPELRGSFELPVVGEIDFLLAKVAMTIVVIFALFALLAIFYSIMYMPMSDLGYSRMDVKPDQYQKYKRRRERDKNRRRR